MDGIPEDSPRPKLEEMSDGDLLTELHRIAPLSDKIDTELKVDDWKEFYSYRERERDGRIARDHVISAINKVNTEVPEFVREHWDVCSARMEDSSGENSLEHKNLRALLRRESEARIEWEKSKGYRK